YLNYCDCRSLGGDCGLPTRTCITYKNGINSFAHRGLSVHISKEQAKEIVIGADKAGLMHTVNPNGICNCCDDCCYLFRAQSRRNSAGFWPKTQHLVEIDGDKCVACGNCVETCRFHALHISERIDADLSRCVGCGICVQACPAKALKLRKRNGNISEKR
ncbi:MAG: 4Fe-4S binding protein, partial [Bacillota bacterium]